jgi:hypothetical protein
VRRNAEAHDLAEVHDTYCTKGFEYRVVEASAGGDVSTLDCDMIKHFSIMSHVGIPCGHELVDASAFAVIIARRMGWRACTAILHRSEPCSVRVLTRDDVKPGNAEFWQSRERGAEAALQKCRLRILGVPHLHHYPAFWRCTRGVALQTGWMVTLIGSRVPSNRRIHRVVLSFPKA